MILTASWLLPVSRPPVRHGAVLVQGNRILAVGTEREICAAYPNDSKRSFGNAILLPGLVNAHSHLDYAIFRGLLQNLPFVRWIRQLVDLKYSFLEREDFVSSSRLSLIEGIEGGITFYADSGDMGTSLNALLESGARGIYFHEVFGPREEDSDQTMDSFRLTLDRLLEKATSLVTVGVSPHAPYTVSEPLLRNLAAFLEENPLPLAIHAAESREEVRFIADAEGPFADWHRERGIRCRQRNRSPIQYLLETGILDGHHLRQLIHVTQATEEDLAMLREKAISVAICPRSNARLRVGIPPLVPLARLGIALGIGTDSAASSDSLSLFEEMRFFSLLSQLQLEASPPYSAKEIVEAATLRGAEALGMDDAIGSLEPGKMADLIAVSLETPSATPIYDPYHTLVYCCSSAHVCLTMVDGQILYDRSHSPFNEAALRKSVEQTAEKLHRVSCSISLKK